MSLGSSSRGNADFGRSAGNTEVVIGLRGKTDDPDIGRCKNATAASGACGRLSASALFDSSRFDADVTSFTD
ncbi:hypothetical protein N7462_011239 [Penicillium macrosclerotiorum]|uniref:uncharacterized protein n=1 Tax=Penicillium macrosclerotiorum TaxID=303699 RepID=UPI0025465B65|nr:uncharacterized protein N7462_011239 [Penicillium macrosclerotiorum]KAJ5666830.1 hypothetical protein N7462_011239 [Penicillium macrosclerotiorum]